MLFDVTLGIGMDEMEHAYYAGPLGKAAKNLPKSCADDEGRADTFTWTLNDSCLPTKVTDGYETYSFNWQ